MYIFRGTTINFEGNTNSLTIPRTSASSHPVKALWFAKACSRHYPNDAVIYIAKGGDVEHLRRHANVLGGIEDELAYKLKPLDFYPHCIGYVKVTDMQKVLLDLGINCLDVVTPERLSTLCETTARMSRSVIEDLVDRLQPFII